jgi:hypothetical protein
MHQVNFFSDEALKLPKTSVLNTLSLQMGHRIEEILGACSPMAASSRKNIRHFL